MDIFYKNFEDAFRGSRELIKQRLNFYLPIFAELKRHVQTPKVLDLGCGRGEWLELLKEQDINAQGVDLDEGMLIECQSLGLNFVHGDVMDFLKNIADNSCDAITSFHLIEHLPFDILKELVQECFRILKPGGILILETPNAENLVVGTSSFYLDPTHSKPLPSQLISFLTLFYGFKKSHVHFLNSSIPTLQTNPSSMIKIFYGVGPDYTVIAQKEGLEEFSKFVDCFFENNKKTDLSSLLQEYDEKILRMERRVDFLCKIFCLEPIIKIYKKIKVR
jgi:SAM-dependent methyltransferase